MATTVRQTTLTTTITEEVTINGRPRNSTVKKIITGIGEVFTNITSVTTDGTDLAQFAATKGAGVFSTASSGAGQVKYLRITNLDDTNYIELTFSDHVTATSAINMTVFKLDAGKSFMLSNLAFDTEDDDAVDTHELTATDTIAHIRGVANTAACDVEIIIASE